MGKVKASKRWKEWSCETVWIDGQLHTTSTMVEAWVHPVTGSIKTRVISSVGR